MVNAILPCYLAQQQERGCDSDTLQFESQHCFKSMKWLQARYSSSILISLSATEETILRGFQPFKSIPKMYLKSMRVQP